MNNSQNSGSKGFLLVVAILGAVALIIGKVAQKPSGGASSPDKYVKDAAGILSESTKQTIIDLNEVLEEDYGGAQLVVATVKSLDGEHIRIYSKQFFKLNEIGSKKNQNGMLLLVSVEDKDYYAMYGNGLSDMLAGDVAVVLDGYMKDDFLGGNYDSAVAKTVPELAKVLKNTCAEWHGGAASSGGSTSQVSETDHSSGEASVSTLSLGLGFLIKLAFKVFLGGFIVIVVGVAALAILLVFVFRGNAGNTAETETGHATKQNVRRSSDSADTTHTHRSSKSGFTVDIHKSSGKSASITIKSSDKKAINESDKKDN